MRIVVSLISFVSFLAASGPAHAYLDPGSVSLAIQAIVAALAGAVLTWKHWYWRVRGFLGRSRKRKSGTGFPGSDPRVPGGNTDPPPGE